MAKLFAGLPILFFLFFLPMSVAVRLATNYEKKLADLALLPFYCQNTLVALLLKNFKLAWSYIF